MKHLFLLYFLLLSLHVTGQDNCPHYNKYIQKGDAEIAKGNNANFESAINDYSTAMVHCPDKGEEARAKILKVFRIIESLKAVALQEKEKADKNAQEAEIAQQQAILEKEKVQKARKEAEVALKEVERQKSLAEAALKKADKQKSMTEEALQKTQTEQAKNQKLIDSFYFYDNKLALAYRNKKYGFINKEGEVVIDYLYDKVEQFDNTGFAKAQKADFAERDYLIDVEGNEYPVHFKLNTYPFSVKMFAKEKTQQQILALDLRDNGYKGFPNYIIPKYPQLKTLILGGSGTKIKNLPSEIGLLHHLENLLLMDCGVNALPSQIGQLKQLQKLDISNNQLQNLPPELEKLKNLKELNLSNNQFQELPSIIGNLPNLQKINLSDNQFSTLPKKIKNLKQLAGLDISNNTLADTHLTIGQLSNLKYLNLSGNQLEELNFEMSKLSSLHHLDISSNQLMQLPTEIGQMSNLNLLDISGNQLSNLPMEIQQLQKLKQINLSVNRFKEFPAVIGKLNNLVQLDLSFNQLTTLNNYLTSLKDLTYLNLANNQLDSLPSFLQYLTNLTQLDISENPLKKGFKGLQHLKNLKLLILSSNTPSNQELKELQKELPLLNIRFVQNHYAIGIQHFDNKNYQNALSAFLTEIEYNETLAAYYKVSRCYDVLGNYPKAMEYYNKWLKKHNRQVTKIEQIHLRHLNKRQGRGLYIAQKAASRVESNNYIAWFNLSSYALWTGKYKRAIQAARKVLRMNPDLVSTEANLAIGHLLNNQWKSAKEIYLKWRNKQFTDNGLSCNEVFLQDIFLLEKKGVAHPKFKEVKNLIH